MNTKASKNRVVRPDYDKKNRAQDICRRYDEKFPSCFGTDIAHI